MILGFRLVEESARSFEKMHRTFCCVLIESWWKINPKIEKSDVLGKNRWKIDSGHHFLGQGSVFGRFLGPGRIPKWRRLTSLHVHFFIPSLRLLQKGSGLLSRGPGHVPGTFQGPSRGPPGDHAGPFFNQTFRILISLICFIDVLFFLRFLLMF